MSPVPFDGARPLRGALVIAAVGLLLTAVLAALDVRRALFGYHVAFTYWVGIAVAALMLLMIFHAAGARWMTVLRRILEVIPLTTAVLLVLFLPVALGMRHLFPWVDLAGVTGEALHLWQHRRPWLNAPFWLARSAIYFGAWIAVSQLLHRWSVRQDESGDPELTARQRRLGAGALPLVALAITFAAVDWQMSLDVSLASTIYGVYYFAGSFVSAVAVLILAVVAARGRGVLQGVSLNHLHSLGKFLLAFTAFWAYIALSQYLLIWIANVPEEAPWYLVRNATGWRGVGLFLVLFHFVAPFFLLLSRDLKRSPRGLAFMAVWILVVHYVDIYWVVMPRLHPAAPRPGLVDLFAWVGIGAAALAFALWRLRGVSPVPVKDPFLPDSIGYEPNQ
ncbi:MAG TPA: hypothetical protein VFR85_16390 [Anaeromyxobacteraceae bacterium]|nr:hypothetical protein [Anaeromyxobacteraceae bacterium]